MAAATPHIHIGPRNSITDVAGLAVGSSEHLEAFTGVTVVVPEVPVTATVDARGGTPVTFNTDILSAGGIVTGVHGLVIGGGSIFGLDAAMGLAYSLAAAGKGDAVAGLVVPMVSGAILFDLDNGGSKTWGMEPLYRHLAIAASEALTTEVRLGNAGAGFGAVAGTLKGGLGTASAVDSETGITIAALVAVNAVGSVTMPESPTMWAWHLEREGEVGGQPAPTAQVGSHFETKANSSMNTTIGVIATDAAFDHTGLRRLGVAGHDGLAMAIRPVHTTLDGDTLFTVSTAQKPLPATGAGLMRLTTMATDVVARAVMRGVFAADSLGRHESYRARWGARLRNPAG